MYKIDDDERRRIAEYARFLETAVLTVAGDALKGFFRRLPAALAGRSRLPARVEGQVRLLEERHDH